MNDSSDKSVMVPKVTIDWYRSAPWWRLVSHSIAISWRASHIVLCALALLATHALVGFSDFLFSPEEHSAPTSWIVPGSNTPAIVPWSVDPSQWYEELHKGRLSDNQDDAKPRLEWFHPAPDSFMKVWLRYVCYPFHALDGITLRKSAYFLWNTLAIIAVWGFVGGVLARRSVQELGMHITSPWIDTIRWVVMRWRSIMWSVLMPIGLTSLFCLIPLILGWISNITVVGLPVAMLLMMPTALMALGVGWVLAISLFGFSLSTVAIVTEKQADAFDGMSRASAYVFQRPATLFLAVLVAEWMGHFAGSVVSIVLNTGYNIIAQAFSLVSYGQLGFMKTWLDDCFEPIVPLLVTAFGFSLFWTASTAIYLVLRRDVDRAEFDLIDMGSTASPKSLPKIPSGPQAGSKDESDSQAPVPPTSTDEG